MKLNIIAGSLLMIVAYSFMAPDCKQHFAVRIIDKDFSLGYSVSYQVDRNNIVVKYFSDGKPGKVLMRKTLVEMERERICKWFSTHNIDSFLTKYQGRPSQDGVRRAVYLEFGDKKKDIYLANYQLRDMEELYAIINQMVNKELQL